MATVKTAPTPGPKPDYFVVEDHLKCQTGEGEKSIDMRIPLDRIELFMDMGELDLASQKLPRYTLDNILWPEDRDELVKMRDGAKVIEIITEFTKALGKRMGADMGESEPSIASSESIERPSDTTSDTDSE
ncbi:hypothetical protein D6T64_12130 [Cryobacterium melibiosiphilum]|uniref:Tail assembly chaperone n=1 Tax=Cryobacterium melibiosiphilum TaxID=995039 RepID=A0A3A5MDC2_9MICO|nr:hypothetical protein [Cryobacterium melibiosiphilum]RJT88127.1 hypothetical protein D6T64_12130 [Cryobacterium melibiosiphilum]